MEVHQGLGDQRINTCLGEARVDGKIIASCAWIHLDFCTRPRLDYSILQADVACIVCPLLIMPAAVGLVLHEKACCALEYTSAPRTMEA